MCRLSADDVDELPSWNRPRFDLLETIEDSQSSSMGSSSLLRGCSPSWTSDASGTAVRLARIGEATGVLVALLADAIDDESGISHAPPLVTPASPDDGSRALEYAPVR